MQGKLEVKNPTINCGKAEEPEVFMVGKDGSSPLTPEGRRTVPFLVAKETTLSGSGKQRERKVCIAAPW